MNLLGQLFGAAIVMLFLGALFAFPTMWLWNGTLVPIFPDVVPEITTWQALGLCFLFRFLFGTGTSGS